MCCTSEEDITHELQTLLELARVAYKEEGVPDKKSVFRFIEDFVNEQWYINCSNAYCRNFHRRNINIVSGILARKDLLMRLMEPDSFSMKDCEDILRQYDSTDAPPSSRLTGLPYTVPPPLSFGCTLTDEQMVRISFIANTNRLFCVSKGKTLDLKPLLQCEEGATFVSHNNRLVAILFDQLSEKGMINSNWQYTLEKSGILLSRTGKPVKATTLSSALCGIRKNPTAESKKFKKELENFLLMSKSDIK